MRTIFACSHEPGLHAGGPDEVTLQHAIEAYQGLAQLRFEAGDVEGATTVLWTGAQATGDPQLKAMFDTFKSRMKHKRPHP